MKAASLLIFAVLSRTFGTFAAAETAETSIGEKLRVAMTEAFKEAYSDSEVHSAMVSVNTVGDSADAARSAVLLWITKDDDILYVAWLEQTDAANRGVLALLITGSGTEMRTDFSRKLKWMASRFEAKEAAARLGELKFVDKNRSRLVAALVRSLPLATAGRLRVEQGILQEEH